ncbi:hypothetical protein AAGG74_16230 [Bacillus mexicanus]|uniref:hypothetical protein n=1 Tax=Bacillus mexicanus TaxID=2834415 RepID=UPI003D1CD75C
MKAYKFSFLEKSLCLTLGITLVMLNPVLVSAASSTQTFNFSESTSQKQTKTFSLPINFDSVGSISSDNGDVSYDLDDGQINITVDNGKPTSSSVVFNPQKYEKKASLSSYSNDGIFSNTQGYSDDEGYSGTLNLNGSPYVVSGTYTPASSKTITITEESDSPNNFIDSINYRSDGYSGVLHKSGNISYSDDPDREEHMYKQEYSGTVNSKSIDTRIWRADYTGTVFKGGDEKGEETYTYKVTLKYKVKDVSTSNCSYKGISPTSNTIKNYVPKCLSVKNNSNSLYKLVYDFNVTGVSNAGS